MLHHNFGASIGVWQRGMPPIVVRFAFPLRDVLEEIRFRVVQREL